MKEIKFATGYEDVVYLSDKNFKTIYKDKVGNKPGYTQVIGGETKHYAVCPRCNNAAIILGIYKKIDTAPHARHAKGINIKDVTDYDEYRYLHCPYHRRNANYIKEYVPETDEPQRRELYRLARENFDKAIYLLQKRTGIHITLAMAEALAKNYAAARVYNYIDATNYNIPWYLVYDFPGFPLYHLIIEKNTTLYKHVVKSGLTVRDSRVKNCVYVADNMGYLLIATDYRYTVGKNDSLNEWLKFSILRPDDSKPDILLYTPVEHFSVSVDSYHFGNLINLEDWTPNEKLLAIADECMGI